MERFDCGMGDGMYENSTGYFVRYSDHEKEVALLKQYIDELFECASNGLEPLALDMLYDIVDKFENK
jgi:hypothetical protein